jgi:hypothetical protein
MVIRVLKNRELREVVFLADGIFFFALSAAFALQVTAVVNLWPWAEEPICIQFFAALLAAYGAGCFMLARLKDWPAAAGGSLAMLVAFGGFALQVAEAQWHGHQTQLELPAAILATVALLALGTLVMNITAGGAQEKADPRLLLLFRVMAPLLYLVGLALLAGAHAILPWPLSPQTRALLGWVLLGFSFNYGYTALQGGRSGTRILLAGLLTYDAAMIMPLLAHITDVLPGYRLTLMLNIAVVLTTASIATFHLFVLPRSQEVRPVESAPVMAKTSAVDRPHRRRIEA